MFGGNNNSWGQNNQIKVVLKRTPLAMTSAMTSAMTTAMTSGDDFRCLARPGAHKHNRRPRKGSATATAQLATSVGKLQEGQFKSYLL